jgi:hypothetical protein
MTKINVVASGYYDGSEFLHALGDDTLVWGDLVLYLPKSTALAPAMVALIEQHLKDRDLIKAKETKG